MQKYCRIIDQMDQKYCRIIDQMDQDELKTVEETIFLAETGLSRSNSWRIMMVMMMRMNTFTVTVC